MTDEELNASASLIVAGAIAASGEMDNIFAWRNRVMQAIGEVGALMREGSDAHTLAAKVVAANVFKATFIGFEEEFGKTADGTPSEKATRLIIKTQSDAAIKNNPGKNDHNPEGFEYTRSEPLWTAAGRAMRAKVEKIQQGTPILVYKYTEQIDQNKKVRVLVHFDVLGRPPSNDRQAAPPKPPAAQPVERRPYQSAPPVEGSPADNAAISEIERRFDAMSAKQRIAFGRSCRDAGFTDFMLPAPEHLGQVLDLLTAAEAS